MKLTSIMLLIVLSFTVLTPISSFSIIVDAGQMGEMFSNLDVCHSSAPALSSNGEMPCVHNTASSIILVVFLTVHKTVSPVFTELILATRNEQPPQS